MKIFYSKKIFLLSLIGLAFFVVDRLLKILAIHNKIFFYKNYNLSFSVKIPANLFLYLYILSFLILFILIWQLVKFSKKNYNLSNYRLQITGYGLLFLGIASNLIDRLKYGFVVDYFNFYFFYNNLADIMIFFSVLIIFFYYLRKDNMQTNH